MMSKVFDASSIVIHVHVFMTLSHKYDMIIWIFYYPILQNILVNVYDKCI